MDISFLLGKYVFLVLKLKLGGYKYHFQKSYQKFSWSKINIKSIFLLKIKLKYFVVGHLSIDLL